MIANAIKKENLMVKNAVVHKDKKQTNTISRLWSSKRRQ